jgi:lipopolysaccharide transport system permease protein
MNEAGEAQKLIESQQVRTEELPQKHSEENSYSVEIKPAGKWFELRLSELVEYRELFFFLAWRDIKIRYKQTVLGALWAILQPVLTVAIFSLIFGRFVGIKSDDIPYPLFAFCGLLPWTFINTTINSSSNSIISNTNLITKIYFPRLIIPISSVGAGLIDFILSLTIFIGIMFYYQTGLHAQMVFAPLFLLMMFILAIAGGTLLSALNVRFRDVKQILPFGMQIWMFASPVLYPTSLFPEKWRWVMALNPLTGILEGLRSSLFGRPFDFIAIGCSVIFIFVLLFIAVIVFRNMEDYFADYV